MCKETRALNKWGKERRTGLATLPEGQAWHEPPSFHEKPPAGYALLAHLEREDTEAQEGGHLAKAIVQLRQDEPLLLGPSRASELLPLGHRCPFPGRPCIEDQLSVAVAPFQGQARREQ